MSRFATFDAGSGYIRPRVDAIPPNQRLDHNAPPVMAYLEGRPVFLARPDPRYQSARMGRPLTVPLTVSRMQRAYDLERGYDPGPYIPSPLAGPPTLNKKGLVTGALMTLGLGVAFGAGAGALLRGVTWGQGAKVGGVASLAAYGVAYYAMAAATA